MKKLEFALFAVILIVFASCGGIKPESEKIDGPLGPYFEVVNKTYKADNDRITFDLKRIKEGLPEPWKSEMTMGIDDYTYEMAFKADFLGSDGKVCSDAETDIYFDAAQLMNLVNLKVGETGSITFEADTEKAKTVKLGSDFKVWEPTLISLSGSLGKNLPICMSLYISCKGEVRGAYYYKKMGPKALLFLKGDKKGDQLDLMEYNKKGDHTGEYEGTFTGNRYRGEFEAYYGGTFDYDLKEDKEMEFIDFSGVDFDEFVNEEFYVREIPASLGSGNWDEILDRYEKLVNDYVRLVKKARNGDLSAATEMASLASEYEDLSEDIESASGSMTMQQANRYAAIQRKMLKAIE